MKFEMRLNMLVDYLANSIVYKKENYVDVEKTINKLLENIEKAYNDLQTSEYPAKEWVENENLMPFSQGNHKLPATTYIINLGTAGLCPGRALGNCNCRDICYAKNAETQYKENVINRRLLQTLRWRKLSAKEIAKQLLDKSDKALKNKMQYLRINESGDVFDQSDIKKMSDIADILASRNVGTYTYSSRYDLDWSKKSDNLIVNGSGWICDNSFIAVDEFTDDMMYRCSGECDTCSYCKEPAGRLIYVKVHGNGR